MKLFVFICLFFCTFTANAEEQALPASMQLNIPNIDEIRKSIPTQDSPELLAEKSRHDARISRLMKMMEQENFRHDSDLKSLAERNAGAIFLSQEEERHSALAAQHLIAINAENERFRNNMLKIGVPVEAINLMLGH